MGVQEGGASRSVLHTALPFSSLQWCSASHSEVVRSCGQRLQARLRAALLLAQLLAKAAWALLPASVFCSTSQPVVGIGGEEAEPHISFLDPASHDDLVLLPRVHLKSKLAVDGAF